MTTEKLQTCESMTCTCGRLVMIGADPDTGHASVLHQMPQCEEFMNTEADKFVEKLRASQKSLTE